MKIAEVQHVVQDFISEYHTVGAEAIIIELAFAMKKYDPFYRDGTNLVRMMVSAIRRVNEEDENDQM